MTDAYRCKRIAHGFLRAGDPVDEVAQRCAALNVDMVELDVMSHDGDLVIAHDPSDLAKPGLITLDQALAALTEHLPADVGLNVDLKGVAFERETVRMLEHFGLAGRALVSTMNTSSLPVLRRASRQVRVGWSVPRARRDYLANRLTRPIAHAAMMYYRLVLPGRTSRTVVRGHADAIMAHWGVVTPRLSKALSAAGAELYVWTVDDAAHLPRLLNQGVTGVITNQPEIFDAQVP